jgi:WD40 repeat protein
VFTASTSLQYAYEGSDLTTETEPSFFTAALVRGLESGAGSTGDWISVNDLWEHVRRDLLEHSPRQTPQRYISGDDLLIARNPRPSLSRTDAERHRRVRPRDYSRLVPHVRLEGGGDELFSVAISSTGKAIAAGTDGAVLVWRSDEEIKTWTSAPEPEQLIEAASYVYAVAFSPDGDAVASAGEDCVVRVTGLDGRELLRKTKAEKGHGEAVYSLAFSPDGKYLASGGWDGRVIVWNLATGMVHQDERFSGRISSVAFPSAPPGHLLAIGSHDNTVATWDVDGGTPVVLDAGHVSSVEAVALSFDGALLASCGLDKRVRLTDVLERKPAWPDEVREHKYLVRTVAFAPGGATLVSASWDKAMRLWDVATGNMSYMPSYTDWEHSDWIWSVTFSPDGLLLASAGSDSVILVWTLPDES